MKDVVNEYSCNNMLRWVNGICFAEFQSMNRTIREV